VGSYCNETDIEAITQFTISDSTKPTSTQVTAWITEIEADADARALGSYTLTDQYIDVPPELGVPSKDTIAWFRSLASGRHPPIAIKNIVVPPYTPIVSIASLSRRTSALGSTDAWEALTEGRESGNSFIILKRRTKTNQYLGFGLYFHQNNPSHGPERIKMTYNYGWNLSTTIIGEWCALKVSLKVLDAIMHDTTPIGAGDYGVQDVRIGIDPARRRKDAVERIKELEDKYFPKKKLGLALV